MYVHHIHPSDRRHSLFSPTLLSFLPFSKNCSSISLLTPIRTRSLAPPLPPLLFSLRKSLSPSQLFLHCPATDARSTESKHLSLKPIVPARLTYTSQSVCDFSCDPVRTWTEWSRKCRSRMRKTGRTREEEEEEEVEEGRSRTSSWYDIECSSSK